MKKLTLLFGICFMALFISTSFVNAEENYILSLEDGELINGIKEIVFWSASEGELSLSLDGEQVEGEKVGGLVLGFSASEIDFKNNSFFYNDNLICKIEQGAASQKERLNIDSPESGDIEITLLPSVGDTVLDVTQKYGDYNIDDMAIKDVHILLPNGNKIIPKKVIKALPVVGASGVTESEHDYNGESLRIGDGWSSETGLGGSTPNVPVYLTFRFDTAQLKDAAGQSVIYQLDTTKLNDGKHTFDMFLGETKVKTVKFEVDNTPPTFVSNVKFGQAVNKDFVPSVIAVDENAPVDIVVSIDGIPFEGGSLKDFDYGRHTITVVASDLCGNTSAEAFQITIIDEETLVNKNAVELSMDGKIRLPYTQVGAPKRLELFTYTPVQKIKTFTIENDKQKDYSFGTVTETGASDSPEHYFDLTISDKEGEFKFEYLGTSSENTDIAIYAKNHNEESWDIVGKCVSGVKGVVTISSPKAYIKDGIISLKATPDYVISVSDTLLWVTDTQYYSRFEDLYPTYETIMDYSVNMFNQGKIGYVMHTGDVVDEIGEIDFATKQFEAASRIQKIIEDAGIPNGIVSGNHDVVMDTADHTLFNKYFGVERYESEPWYGGNLESNTSHYDLITIGGYDFLFLYLGWGVEARPETIAWANNILKQYQNRNAIICTHGYLGLDGDWQIDLAAPLSYTHTRAREIWEEIVVPNNNVLGVFCGHMPGVARNLRQVGDSDRYVWEVLADYQFVEKGVDPQHTLNGITCDGEGYIRLVSFDGKKMHQKTYSPLHDDYNYFGDEKDEFIVDFVLKSSKHTLKTESVSALSAYKKLDMEMQEEDNAVVFTVEREKSHGKIILIAEDEDGKKYESGLRNLNSSNFDFKMVLGVVGIIIAVTGLALTPLIIGKRKKKNGK